MNQVKSQFQIIAASVSTLYFALFAYGAFVVIRQFEKIFDSFGAELPIQTAILIGSYRYWGVLCLISVFVLYKVIKGENRRSMTLLTWLFVLSLCLVLFATWGIYSPVLAGSG
ncbi:hypothetical protein Q3O60_14350 [Alkalimonas collagenimarina]|uniref:Uncharacterized protein n=1 Tax=Alkalimonas collagenimarina TaxID=400390 RepID=A0ABT9H389_9GAMM|nr:hypothetical protein [Alkalimonas collagenimarina]MDP4537370.1 hypothetical protein [Alkalimonas collagenimarina]